MTREAFDDYLEHLTPNGILYFTRPEAQIPRLFATAREVLAARGVTDIPAHLYAYRDPPGAQGATPRLSFSAGFLLKKAPFTAAEIQQIEALIGVVPAANNPYGHAPAALYSPFEAQTASIYTTILTAPDLRTVYQREATQLAPATDDRPFFNQHLRWSSLTPRVIRDLFTQGTQGRLALEDRPVAEVVLLVLLAQVIVITAVLLLLPLALLTRAGRRRVPQRWRFLLYFAGLGLGFMMIEIALLGRFTLFLGQPVYTFAVVLASLLLFTGVGAYLSERFGWPPHLALRRIIPLLLLILLATAFSMPPIFATALGLPLFGRIIVAITVLAPLGMLLGMPFPTGLRLVAADAPSLVAWSWGVNGFFTVIGTVIAQIVGMSFGFNLVFLVAACCYLLALTAIAKRNQAF